MLELNFRQMLGNHHLNINETLPGQGVTAIFGVSGAGKTSLINAISGLTRPDSGRIVLNDRVLSDAEQHIFLRITKSAATCATAWRSLCQGSSINWWRC